MANELIRKQPATKTEELHHGHFSMLDRAIDINGIHATMSKGTYEAIKADILTAADGKSDIESISIDAFDSVVIK